MWTGIRRRRQVVRRNKSAPQALGRRRKGGTGLRLIVVALVAVGLSTALAGPALAAGPPTVTNIDPKHATPAGGTSVTIIGTNFTGATAVKFGTLTNAASFTVNSSTMITAVSPPGEAATSVNVIVTTPEGTSATSAADEFSYRSLKSCQEVPPPVITSVEPKSGPLGGGTTVTIKGERFFETVCSPPEGFKVEKVWFGSAEGTNVNFVKEGEVTAISPSGTGTVDVTVETFIGQSPITPSDQFAYPPAPAYHWYRNGTKLAEGKSVPIVMFGGKTNLSQQNCCEVNCRTVLAGTIENPPGGGAGVGRTNSMAFYECKAEKCETEVLAKTGLEGRFRTTTENNPAATNEAAFPGWSDALEESTVAGVTSVREKIGEPWESYKTPSPPGMIRETQICEIAPTKEAVAAFTVEGELKPEIGVAKTANLNGTKAAVPSRVKFNDASTGAMHSEGAGETTVSGELKYLGYNEQEVITVKP